jgi:WD40 repeat protein
LFPDAKKAVLAGFVLPKPKKGEESGEIEAKAYVTLFDLQSGISRPTRFVDSRYLDVQLLGDGAVLVREKFGIAHLNLSEGKKTEYLMKPHHSVYSLAALPGDREFIASYAAAGLGTGPILVRWNLRDKEYVEYEDARDTWHLTASRDGKHFSCSEKTGNDMSVAYWETAKKKRINTLRLEKVSVHAWITGVVVADDGKTVLSVWHDSFPQSEDFTPSRLIAWDGEANKILWSRPVSYRGHLSMVVNGDKLFVGGGPDPFEVWSIKDGKKLESWGGHLSPVNAIGFLKAKNEILTAGSDGQVMTWRDGKITHRRNAHSESANALVIDEPRKRWLSGGEDHVVRVWDCNKEKPIRELKGPDAPIRAIAVSADGEWAAANGWTWDLTTGQATTEGAGRTIHAVAISPDGSWLAQASTTEDFIEVTPRGKKGKRDLARDVDRLKEHKWGVSCLAFSPDGKTLLSGSHDKTVIVWDWRKHEPIRTLTGHKGSVTSLMFLDAKTLLTTSEDQSLRMWNIETGKEMGCIDFGSVGDCPKCLTRVAEDRILVGSSGWLIYEFAVSRAADR